MRLDQWLTQAQCVPSRARAKAAIVAGLVLVNGKIVTRSAYDVGSSDTVVLTGDPIGYVSRGGQKLAAALDAFSLNPKGLDCLDVGASTGGFTDCLLQRGASRVAAIDVGHNQLHPSLAADARVLSLAQTDVRTLSPTVLTAAWIALPAFAVIDVSFISLRLVLPTVVTLTRPDAHILALIKPQFEAGRAALGKRGIVKDERVREQAVAAVVAAAGQLGLHCSEPWLCPIPGGDGNREYFVHMRKATGSHREGEADGHGSTRR